MNYSFIFFWELDRIHISMCLLSGTCEFVIDNRILEVLFPLNFFYAITFKMLRKGGFKDSVVAVPL